MAPAFIEQSRTRRELTRLQWESRYTLFEESMHGEGIRYNAGRSACGCSV